VARRASWPRPSAGSPSCRPSGARCAARWSWSERWCLQGGCGQARGGRGAGRTSRPHPDARCAALLPRPWQPGRRACEPRWRQARVGWRYRAVPPRHLAGADRQDPAGGRGVVRGVGVHVEDLLVCATAHGEVSSFPPCRCAGSFPAHESNDTEGPSWLHRGCSRRFIEPTTRVINFRKTSPPGREAVQPSWSTSKGRSDHRCRPGAALRAWSGAAAAQSGGPSIDPCDRCGVAFCLE
jgi:hypothetical protein